MMPRICRNGLHANMGDSAVELETTRRFWDANPCGIRGDFAAIRAHRYAMEPWLPGEIERIARAHGTILEVGCGQGVDSISLCAAMAPGGTYRGIDYSPASIEVARSNAADAASALPVRPVYAVGNAESLAFDDASFEAVYSMGVVHHTADPARAIAEIHRVLKPGGKAYLALYRKPSLKVGVAQALRAFQRGLDRALGTDRVVYGLLRRRASHSRTFGTMFLECFGVPFMAWYSSREIEQLFGRFADAAMKPVGANLGSLSWSKGDPSPFGYFWWVTATK